MADLTFLQGEKVSLRPHLEGDIDKWALWFNDPQVTDGMFKGQYPNTLKKQREFFATMYDSPANLQLAIVETDGGALVGTIGLHGIDQFHRTADISIVLGERSAWGKGYGKEALSLLVAHAFDKLCLHKVTGGMYAVNEGSRRLFESLGFVREAVFREQAAYRGGRTDIYKYGLLAEEWRAAEKEG